MQKCYRIQTRHDPCVFVDQKQNPFCHSDSPLPSRDRAVERCDEDSYVPWLDLCRRRCVEFRAPKDERLAVGYETLVRLNLSMIRKAEPVRQVTFVGDSNSVRSRALSELLGRGSHSNTLLGRNGCGWRVTHVVVSNCSSSVIVSAPMAIILWRCGGGPIQRMDGSSFAFIIERERVIAVGQSCVLVLLVSA